MRPTKPNQVSATDSDARIVDSYDHLRALARARLREAAAMRPSIAPTELVHEVLLRLKPESRPRWHSTGHFVNHAAVAMRHVLVDRLRSRLREKRGGGTPTQLGTRHVAAISEGQDPIQDLVIPDLLQVLAQTDERASTVARLKLVDGLDEREIAARLEVTTRTVRRDWQFARTWLQGEILETLEGDDSPEADATPRVRHG